jgi:hypothetical protein
VPAGTHASTPVTKAATNRHLQCTAGDSHQGQTMQHYIM